MGQHKYHHRCSHVCIVRQTRGIQPSFVTSFRVSIFTFNISISLHLFVISQSFQSKYISSYQHADTHVGTFPHLLSLRVFKDKGHMIMCIFLYQLLTSNIALSVILSCCYLVLAANRNKATGGESKVESLGGNRLNAVRYVVQLLLVTYDGFATVFM